MTFAAPAPCAGRYAKHAARPLAGDNKAMNNRDSDITQHALRDLGQWIKLTPDQKTGPASQGGFDHEHDQEQRPADADSQPQGRYSFCKSARSHKGSFDRRASPCQLLIITAERKPINIVVVLRKQVVKFVLDKDDVILVAFGF